MRFHEMSKAMVIDYTTLVSIAINSPALEICEACWRKTLHVSVTTVYNSADVWFQAQTAGTLEFHGQFSIIVLPEDATSSSL